MIYSARVLDQNRTLLGILDCTKWGYSRKISEATEVSISIPRKQTSAIKNCDELFAFMNPVSPTETNDSWDTSTDPTQELAYFIEIYKDKQRLITALIAKRDFTDTTIELKCYTEETLLTKYLTPAQYGRKYESWDIADIARDMAKGWSVQRVKAKAQWDAGTLVNVDTSTEPGKVLLSKSSGTYNASGSVTLTFSRPTNWSNWERIRWVGDFDGAVAVKMQYSTNGGSTWSAEYVGGEPDTLGIEIATTSATTVMVRLNLSTSDTTSQDSEGNAVGVTPRLFAVEVIARTTAYLTVSAEASTGLLCNGLELDKSTPLEVLTAACQQVGKEFWVDDNTLYLGTMGSDKSNDIFLRKGTNMRITQLGDELAEVYNVIHAMGSGSGINRLEYTESDTMSIATYGVREKTEEFDTEDYDELVSLAQAYLAEHKDPIYAWKVKAQYPIDDEPTYGCGDTITVTDGVIVTTSRIEQMDRSYDNGISVMLYLNKTRADLIQRVKPTYSNLTTFERPIALSVYPTIKGLIASVSRPVDLSRWDYTELYLSTTADFTPSFETLNSEKKATMFEVNDLSPGTRYYVKVRHIANDGTASEFSDERSAVALAVTATDIDVRAGWDLAENSPSTGQVLIYGKDINGNATEENGFITSGSGVLTVNYQAITPIDDKTNFLRLSAGVVIPIYYDVNDNKFYDASNTEVTTGVIIGTVTKASGSITSSQAYARAITIEQGKADQVSTAMRYLAQATDSESFDAIAKGLGIENVFKTLAVYTAFINNLNATNMTAGLGNGTASSGFRFRAMSDSTLSGGDNPVFDVMYDNKKLFEVVATGTDAGDVIIGDYDNGNGIRYDKSAGKFSVKGTIEAGSSVPYSTVSGAPPSDADNTSTFFASGIAFQTANGKVKINNDGTIEAVGGRFEGDVFANSGYFKGIFDTTALKLEPSATTPFYSSVSNNYEQAKIIVDYLISQGFEQNRYYRASLPNGLYTVISYGDIYTTIQGSSLYYIVFTKSGTGLGAKYNIQLIDSNATVLCPISSLYSNNDSSWVGYKLNASYTLTTYKGGDKLIVSSDMPQTSDPSSLSNYQLYIDPATKTLKVKI